MGGQRHKRHEGVGQRRAELSELDGWWAEAYTPQVGWALGDGQEHGDDPAWDAVEADAYKLLKQEVVPAFYTRDAKAFPWPGLRG